MFKRVLVPLDGSPLAEQALGYARHLGRVLGVPVGLLSCLSSSKPLHDDVRQLAESYLQGVGETLRAAGREVSTQLAAGDAAAAISEAADRQPGTLLIMSTHGRSGAMRWAVGTVTDRVLRSARCAMLIARPTDGSRASEPAVATLVVPLDGSDLAERALPVAVQLAQAAGLGVHLLRAVPRDTDAHLQYPGFAGAWRDEAECAEADCHEYLQRVADRLRKEGVTPVTCAVSHGEPAEVIVDAARDAPDELFVMNSLGRSGIGCWVLGSVAERVARHSPSPVLLLREAG